MCLPVRDKVDIMPKWKISFMVLSKDVSDC